MKESHSKICLATVATDNFIPGTLVMIHSFLKHNKWFKGDIVIIHNGLKTTSRDYLNTCFTSVKLVKIDDQFNAKLETLVAARPELKSRKARFYSLATFQLQHYEKVLFCDGDLLFKHSLEHLFETPQPLLCCGDGAYYRKKWRDSISYKEIEKNENLQNVLKNTFNAGFLLIDQQLLNKKIYTELLMLIDSKIWQEKKTDHTDQILLNVYFSGSQQLIACEYNYMTLHHKILYESESIRLNDAKVIHFNGPAKPWLPEKILHNSYTDIGAMDAYRSWHNDYMECLTLLHMRKRFSQKQPLEFIR